MKNKIILQLIFCLLLGNATFTVYGQSKFDLDTKANELIENAVVECIYEYTLNAPLKADTAKRESMVFSTILQANNSVSKFWDWHLFKKDSIIYASDVILTPDSIRKLKWEYELKLENLFTPAVFKSYKGNKFTVTDEVTFSKYIYTEETAGFQWDLLNDTATVCGYMCYKAATKYGGKEWTAWYAPEIPISDGPWKLGDLPGLILKAEDNTGNHTFVATSIRNSNRPIYLENDANRMKISKKTYEKEKRNFESYDVDDIIDVSGIDLKGNKTMLIDGKRLSLKRHIVYCPLEE